MATMLKDAPRVKSNRLVATLALTIGDTSYAVEPVKAGEFGVRAWRLSKLSHGGEVYDLLQRHDGSLECDCPDFVTRHADHGSQCKHLSCAVRVGLLDAPAIVEAPLPRPSIPGVTRRRNEFDPPEPAPRRPARAFGAGVPADRPTEAERAEAGRVLAGAAATLKRQMEAGKAARESTATAAPETASIEAVAPEPEPTVDAMEWARAVAGKFWSVATPEQRSFAVEVLNCDTGFYAFGRRITPPGPSLADLRSRLDTPAPETAPAPALPVGNIPAEAPPAPCCSPSEPAPCSACVGAPEGFADELAAAVGPLPADEETDLPGWLEGEADRYSALGTAAGLFLARHIRRLARDVNAITTPGVPTLTVREAEARLEALAGAA